MLAADFRGTLAQGHGFFALGEQRQGTAAELNMRNRTLQKIGGPGIKCGQPALAVLMRRDDDCGNLAGAGHHPDFPDEFRPVHLWHAIVHNHQVRFVILQPVQRFYRICIGDGGIFLPHQHHKLGVDPQIGGSVIDYQDARAHDGKHYRGIFKIRLTSTERSMGSFFRSFPDLSRSLLYQ